ncbi:hypothetical protein Tco_0955510 [Tanacetum coccineum]|uniref:Uncharacterized protein n=1 Tax=Tanacetum coccineum TaxID=301880 RepID=A0ABQ5E7E5_9ASTR
MRQCGVVYTFRSEEVFGSLGCSRSCVLAIKLVNSGRLRVLHATLRQELGRASEWSCHVDDHIVLVVERFDLEVPDMTVGFVRIVQKTEIKLVVVDGRFAGLLPRVPPSSSVVPSSEI